MKRFYGLITKKSKEIGALKIINPPTYTPKCFIYLVHFLTDTHWHTDNLIYIHYDTYILQKIS